MTRISSGQTVCPVCGHDNSVPQNEDNTLPEGSILAGKYIVGKVLGRGGFGITYLGYDLVMNCRAAIKEYYPAGLCGRAYRSVRVTPSSAKNQEGYEKGCQEFQNEAMILARFDSPHIVHVKDYFRENGTGYIVMEYLDGNSLTEEAEANGGRIPWERVISLFLPLMPELEKLHDEHLIHRDIKPDNIRVIRDRDTGKERLVLLDFGSVRGFVSAQVTKTYTSMVTHGFAPFEQYSQKSRQGPYTDVYALCATMYAVITGKIPPSATDRMAEMDDVVPFAGLGLNVPQKVDKAIMHGLAVRSADRPQTMRELYNELTETDGPAPSVPSPAQENRQDPVKPETGGSKPGKKALIIPAVLIGAAAVLVFILLFSRTQTNDRSAGIQASVQPAAAETAADPEATEAIDPEITITASVPGETPAEAAEPVSANTPLPTDTPMPTNTPVPTNTLRPRNTPRPTNTTAKTYEWTSPVKTIQSKGDRVKEQGTEISSADFGKVLSIRNTVGGWFFFKAPADGNYVFSVKAPGLSRDNFVMRFYDDTNQIGSHQFERSGTVQQYVLQGIVKGQTIYWWDDDNSGRSWTMLDPYELMITIE